jgi:hypothetical protein
MTTKYKIAEQVMLMAHDGAVSTGSGIDIRDVILVVGQCCNAVLKTDYFSGKLVSETQSLETPLVTACYEKIKVEPVKNVSMITLPAIPQSLPKGQGVWEIKASDDLFGEIGFIPVPAGAWALRCGMGPLSDLLGQTGYVWEGAKVFFTRDITAEGIKEVDVKLIVVDVDALGDYDPLPLPADLEVEVVKQCFQLVMARGATDKVTDSARDRRAN